MQQNLGCGSSGPSSSEDDGTITLLCNVADMGQGTPDTLAHVAAAELGTTRDRIRTRPAPVEPRYANPAINNYATFGSLGLRGNLKTLRTSCAAARELLLRAAAARWDVDEAACALEESLVRHGETGRALPIAALLSDAAKLTPRQVPALPPLSQLPARLARTQAAGKLDGTVVYGIDVRLPGMLTAAVAHGPHFDGHLASVDSRPALAVHGVKRVVQLPNAVAVVAEGYWPARTALMALQPVWAPGPRASTASGGCPRAEKPELVRRTD